MDHLPITHCHRTSALVEGRADLGLAIPHTLIDADSFVATAQQLPDGGKQSPLNRCKFAYIGPFDSQDMIWRIVAVSYTHLTLPTSDLV